MDSRAYAECDGLELASRIRRGELTAEDALQHAYRIVERIDPAVHAFVSLEPDVARRQAADHTIGPFAGAPFALKDCVDFLSGTPRRFGSRLSAVQGSSHTDEVVARLLAAGLTPIGTTNVPEFSSSLTTESRLHGPCRNPWDTGHSVGGSSGGSAAAVAYGAVPIAYGNDSAGSIRVPSACCGVFGFKPSRGRVPMGPVSGEIWFGLFTHHVITRSVRDSAAVLDATHGLDAGAPYGIPAPVRTYLEECTTPPGRLRIAAPELAGTQVALHPACAGALESTVEQLRALGHRVETAPMPAEPSEMHRHLAVLLAVALAEEVPLLAQQSGREIGPDSVETCHRALIERGQRTSALDLSRALEYRHSTARALGRLFSEFDIWLTPALGEPPPLLGEIDTNGDDLDAYLARLARLSPFAAIANFGGVPSMSVPLCATPEGLPLGMMFTGRYADEATLLRLAGQLEARHPWRDRHPPTSAWHVDV